MRFRRDCFELFCLSHFSNNMRTFTLRLRKFGKPAKVHAFQTLKYFARIITRKCVFRPYSGTDRHVNMTELIQAVLTGTPIPKSPTSLWKLS